MSCDVAAAAFLFLAAAHPGPSQPSMLLRIDAPAVSAVSKEPLFADIVKRASGLKADADAYRKGLGGATMPAPLPKFTDFQGRIAALSDLDMKGHLELAKRGTDGDLKCILKGISQDLPKKLNDLVSAKTGPDQEQALRDMSYLLNDNVEVITAPPAPPV